MASPTGYFSYYAFLTKGSVAGTYTVSNVSPTNSPYFNYVADHDDGVVDGKQDNLTQLGDISTDTYDASGTINGNMSTFRLTYIGDTTESSNGAHYGVVGSGTYNGQKVYVLQTTVATYAQGDTVHTTNTTPFDITCFASGTTIRVARGYACEDIAVEDLAVGDLAITATGARRPIRWIGHRKVDCTRNPGPRAAWPVRVAAGAFADNLPSRDLLLSPGHSVCVNVISDVLIPVQELVNGATIAYAPMDEITYWHIELDTHDILLANNLPAESFLEMGANRGLLAKGADAELPAEVTSRTHADFCRRFVDSGPLLDVVRDELSRRAEELGWTPSTAVEILGHVGDRTVTPMILDGVVIFSLLVGDGELVIRTSKTTPALHGGDDPRHLGLAVYDLTLQTEAGETRSVDLDSPDLLGCFHEGERLDGLHYRWMRNDLVVPASLFTGIDGPRMLRLSFEPSTIRGWTRPAPAVSRPALQLVG